MSRQGVKRLAKKPDTPGVKTARKKTPREICGFSLLEVVVIVSILVALVGISIPLAQNLLVDSRANRILEIVDRLRGACQRYWIDTGAPAVEEAWGDSTAEISSHRHDLFTGKILGGPISGWKGPYIDRILTSADFPTVEGRVWLKDTLDNSGFFLQGASGPATSGTGNMLLLEEVPLELAQAIDEKIDGPNVSGDRKVLGKVLYIDTTSNYTDIRIYILKNP